MGTDSIQNAITQSVLACVVAISVFLSISTFAQRAEGTLTGPDFSGDYILVSARGAASETAPTTLHITQSADSFRVGWLSVGKQHWSMFPISTEWVKDGGGGRAKAFFDGDALITERYKDTSVGRHGQLDRWTFLGPRTVRVCRSAYVRESLYQEEEKSGCAVYSRNQTSR
jgi:hypothetical protein